MEWEPKNLCDSLCDIHFIVVVWNQTHNISNVCLYTFSFLLIFKKDTCLFQTKIITLYCWIYQV